MGKTSIEWTDASWNPVVGCTEVSPGCANCYAARLAATRLRSHDDYKNLTVFRHELKPNSATTKLALTRWTGHTRTLPERLREPQDWKKPKRIFVCDMGDLFHESVPHGFLIEVFTAMALAPQHTYQILTKRAERMREWLTAFALVDQHHPLRDDCRWPWPNVWCGVSVENQHFADERIPPLLGTPAAIRFISAEPLLGPVDLPMWIKCPQCGGSMSVPAPGGGKACGRCFTSPGGQGTVCALDWVIAGGESGPNARPMHPDWARSLRDQCVAAGVPFFFKQWGEWLADRPTGSSEWVFQKLGKKKTGRLLDGREWSEFPK